jgi:hypothetical protein
VRIEDTDGTLFATVPVSNENPEISVEPVADSSRYFVIRVSDGSGRHAFLGMGFVERNDALDLNITLQDHVKHARYEAQAERQAEAGTCAEPSKDFSLKGSVSIALPAAAAGDAPKHRDKPVGGPVSMGGLLLPPPPAAAGGGGRRHVSNGPAAAPTPTPAAAADPFGNAGDSWATFG